MTSQKEAQQPPLNLTAREAQQLPLGLMARVVQKPPLGLYMEELVLILSHSQSMSPTLSFCNLLVPHHLFGLSQPRIVVILYLFHVK